MDAAAKDSIFNSMSNLSCIEHIDRSIWLIYSSLLIHNMSIITCFTHAEWGMQTAKETTTQKKCVPKGTFILTYLFII